ncbi:MAG: lipoyl(octanoyl) transferase LipB [Patulibacter sp.]|nr:lipoyl(octanoyl) transferase LipB [Patulibacter sp.]
MSDRPFGPPAVEGGPLGVAWLGEVPYAETLDFQHRLREARIAGRIGDTLLLLEHAPVYTRGRRSTPDELPFGEAWYAERGIEIVDVRRGGKVTYHGPGQLVAYLIARTSDVLWIVRALERAILAVAREHGVEARGRNAEGIEFTGAWVETRKLGSIGLHLSRQVTTHGVGLNVVTDLEPFGWVVPCGLTDPMTSLARETDAPDLGSDPALDREPVMRRVADQFAAALARELEVETTDADVAGLRTIAAEMPEPRTGARGPAASAAATDTGSAAATEPDLGRGPSTVTPPTGPDRRTR